MISVDPDGGALRYDRLTANGVRHVVTTRSVGASKPPFDRGNLAFGVPDDPQTVLFNRKVAAARIGLTIEDMVGGIQVHGKNVARVGLADRDRCGNGRGGCLPATDAFVTTSQHIGLFVLLADCAGLLLYASDVNAIGLAHLGWRGTTARLAEALAQELIGSYGARPENLVGAIAPAIGPCCYEVKSDVVEAVEQSFLRPERLIRKLGRRQTFDIPAAIVQQLEDAGMKVANIDRTDYCTGCRTDLFFSHRAENGRTGRHAMLAALPE